MNLLLLDQHEINEFGKAEIIGPRAEHLLNVVGVSAGDTVRCGVFGGNMGRATVDKTSSENELPHLTLSPQLDKTPPPASTIELICALPRPKMLRRMVRSCAELGIKNITLINSFRVEKSYWQSPVLEYSNLQGILREGLEQAKDTLLPSLQLIPRFKPFVEDILPRMLSGKRGLLAHPYNASVCPVALTEPSILAIGPEGGWNEFEVEKWREAGFEQVHLGDRILKVETAVPTLLSRLYPAGL